MNTKVKQEKETNIIRIMRKSYLTQNHNSKPDYCVLRTFKVLQWIWKKIQVSNDIISRIEHNHMGYWDDKYLPHKSS